eukprot:PhM_4_TR14691/c3_g5_i3/m.68277
MPLCFLSGTLLKKKDTVARKIGMSQDSNADMLELRDLVVKFFVRLRPDFLADVDGEVPMMSAQRALQAYADYIGKKNKAEVDAIPQDIQNLRTVLRLSQARSKASNGSESVVSAKSRASLTRRMLEEIDDSQVCDEEFDEEFHAPRYTHKDLVTNRQSAKAQRRPPVHPVRSERVFDHLPLDLPSVKIPKHDIMVCERWPGHDGKQVYEAVRDFFLDIPRTDKNKQVISEIRQWTDFFLPDAMDNLLAVHAATGSTSRLFALECRSMDRQLQEMRRKKILATHGLKKAEAFAYECGAQDPRLPDWERSANAVLARENKDFQSPAQAGATGASGSTGANTRQAPKPTGQKQEQH